MATVLFITTIHKKVDLTHKEQKTKRPVREATNSEFFLFVKSLHKMVTPPRPPFMKSLFIYFFVNFLSGKKDDFEGCLKGVDGCFKGA